jgi:hypothetical protein
MTPTICYHIVPSSASLETPSIYHERLRQQEAARELRFKQALAALAPKPFVVVTLEVWDKIKGNVPGVVQVPFVDLMESGAILLTWDHGAHHLDVEVSVDTPLDFFYLNRNTGEAWDIESAVDLRLPEKVLQCLNNFRVIL